MVILGIFEDEEYENLLPITYTRPIYEVKCGIFTLRERLERALARMGHKFDKKVLFMRDYLAPVYRKKLPGYAVNDLEAIDDDVVLINGKLLAMGEALKLLEKLPEHSVIVVQDDHLVLARLRERLIKEVGDLLLKPIGPEFIETLKGSVEKLEVTGQPLLRYPWEIIVHNSELMKEDFKELVKGKESQEVPDKVTVIGPRENLFISENVEIEPYVVFKVDSGPIFVDKNVEIQAGARIEGPTFIGERTIIIGGAQVREGSNIGPVCRVGGELEESIMHAYSNKYHYGFIGHAYIGEWVNIGAGTTNSDLKDTYGTVRMTIRGKRVDTGILKVGCFIGDMVKTSIGVLIYTGKKIGIASHLHGIIARDVPSFTIWAESLGAKPTELYLESAIEIQRRMMARRKVTLGPEEEQMIRKLFEITAGEREEAGVVKGKFTL